MLSTLHNILLGFVSFIGQMPKPVNGAGAEKPRSLRELLPKEVEIQKNFVATVYGLERADSQEKIVDARSRFEDYYGMMSRNGIAGPEMEYLEMARRRIEKLAEERGTYLKSGAYLYMAKK